MIVTTRLEVAIGHRLFAYEGKCASIHGHNYIFKVSVNGKPNNLGIVVDFKDLKRDLKEILDPFDHALVLHRLDPISDVLMTEKLVLLSGNPTAENFASLVFNKLVDKGYSPAEVLVQETEDGWAQAISVDRTIRMTKWKEA